VFKGGREVNTRINGIEQIETAIRVLASYGYDMSPVRAQHNTWIDSLDRREPTELDSTWASQTSPSIISEHTNEGVFEVLSAARCFADRQFTLSPGQRETLREQHGLTPTRDVLISNVVTFPGTKVISQFTLRSTEHISEERRRHVLVSAVIYPAATFFETSARRDKEREEEAVETDKKAVKKGAQPKTPKLLAMQYFE
jgi:hypothetical protein